ncbi:hypothetical protein E2C01_067359 [Portunus trituberculatus]|uniref:Uncharacterized protein n=1 Tax=Portunus trituberculatus TaxID=210409 RepID=A0A5B7HNW6_PORTR|nr:hypothetical protein [Portunus trituberculatus]
MGYLYGSVLTQTEGPDSTAIGSFHHYAFTDNAHYHCLATAATSRKDCLASHHTHCVLLTPPLNRKGAGCYPKHGRRWEEEGEGCNRSVKWNNERGGRVRLIKAVKQLVIQRPDYSEPPTPAPSGRDSGVPWPKQTLPPSPPPLLPSPLLSLGDCLAAHPSGLANAYHHHHHRRRRRPARFSFASHTFCHSKPAAAVTTTTTKDSATLWILHGILTLHGQHLLVLLVVVAARERRVAGWRGSQSRSLWVVYVFGQVWCCGAISPL